jgi:hypothetical protein
LPELLPRSSDVFTYLQPHIPVRFYEHVAVVHRGGSPGDLGPEFVSEGLARGHWCCCLAPASRRPEIITQLRDLGADVERHLQGKTLQFPPDEGDALDQARGFFADAEAARAPAVRWLEAGGWATRPGISVPQFFELHARLNYLVKHYPSVALCEYDTEQMEVPHLFSAIAVHRHLLVEGTLVRDNPFYIPAEKFLTMPPEDRGRELRDLFREVGFDLPKLLSILADYGRLQRPEPEAGSVIQK